MRFLLSPTIIYYIPFFLFRFNHFQEGRPIITLMKDTYLTIVLFPFFMFFFCWFLRLKWLCGLFLGSRKFNYSVIFLGIYIGFHLIDLFVLLFSHEDDVKLYYHKSLTFFRNVVEFSNCRPSFCANNCVNIVFFNELNKSH